MSTPDPNSQIQPGGRSLGDRVAGWVFLSVLTAGILALLAIVLALLGGIEAFTLWAGSTISTTGGGLALGLVVAPLVLLAYVFLEACGEGLVECLVSPFSARVADALRVLLVIGLLIGMVAWRLR